MRVLVTDGANRVALAAVRALGRAGASVVVVEQERFAAKTPPAFVSRFAARHDLLPSLPDEDRFIEALARRAAEVDVLLPVSTNVVIACAKHRSKLAVAMALPPLETIRRANDKSCALAAARKVGVPIPTTFAPESEEELKEVVDRLRLPAVVKLRDDEGTTLDPGARYAVARTAGEVEAAWRNLHRIRPFPLVQEKVEGEGFGVGVVAREGRILAAVTHRRVREYPVSGGPSSLCETVRDARLEGYAARLLGELRWTGPAMVEFKKDDDYRLMEINPRLWGSLPLAAAAGVNIPHVACRLALGEEPAHPPLAKAGVRVRFLGADLAGAAQALFGMEARPGVVSGFLSDLLEPGIIDGIFDAEDLRASLLYFSNRLP